MSVDEFRSTLDPMSLAIEARGLTKRYGGHLAVDRFDLEVRQGELLGLLGPHGSGKTTLVRMLAALTPATSGEARVAGVDVAKDGNDAHRVIGIVPHAFPVDLDLTAYENVDIGARYFGVSRGDRRARIRSLLERASLWAARGQLVNTFSLGMRRRLEIVLGLVHLPRVVLLDEPTLGLDLECRAAVWDLLRTLRADPSLTILLSTCDPDEAEALCDRVILIDRGQRVALMFPGDGRCFGRLFQPGP